MTLRSALITMETNMSEKEFTQWLSTHLQSTRVRVIEEVIPKCCCVCGTAENLHKDGWYGYRCSSVDCVCF